MRVGLVLKCVLVEPATTTTTSASTKSATLATALPASESSTLSSIATGTNATELDVAINVRSLDSEQPFSGSAIDDDSLLGIDDAGLRQFTDENGSPSLIERVGPFQRLLVAFVFRQIVVVADDDQFRFDDGLRRGRRRQLASDAAHMPPSLWTELVATLIPFVLIDHEFATACVGMLILLPRMERRSGRCSDLSGTDVALTNVAIRAATTRQPRSQQQAPTEMFEIHHVTFSPIISRRVDLGLEAVS